MPFALECLVADMVLHGDRVSRDVWAAALRGVLLVHPLRAEPHSNVGGAHPGES